MAKTAKTQGTITLKHIKRISGKYWAHVDGELGLVQVKLAEFSKARIARELIGNPDDKLVIRKRRIKNG
jgi:hypothetical protein